MRARGYVRVHARVRVRARECTHVCMCVCARACDTYIHTCIHAHTYTQHTRTYATFQGIRNKGSAGSKILCRNTANPSSNWIIFATKVTMTWKLLPRSGACSLKTNVSRKLDELKLLQLLQHNLCPR